LPESSATCVVVSAASDGAVGVAVTVVVRQTVSFDAALVSVSVVVAVTVGAACGLSLPPMAVPTPQLAIIRKNAPTPPAMIALGLIVDDDPLGAGW